MTLDKHPSLEKLQRYNEGTLPDFQECALEDHLAECEECASAIERIEALVFSGFTAAAHDAAVEHEVLLADPLARAIRRAIDEGSGAVSILEEWLEGAAALWGQHIAPKFGEFAMVPIHALSASDSLDIELSAADRRAELIVRESVQTVKVYLPGFGPSLVLLFAVPDEGNELSPVLVAQLLRVGDASRATFPAVPEGHYYLAISPR
jgi:hypothetical protein